MSRSVSVRFATLLCTLSSLLFVVACESDSTSGCLSCHREYTGVMDQPPHNLGCTTCHRGNGGSSEKKKAHRGLIAAPAHPDQMEQYCGECHKEQVDALRATVHYTLAPATNTFREAFHAPRNVESFTEVKPHSRPNSPLQLADDLLRRRCFRCHLFFPGDEYSAVRHGVGCAACHMPFANGTAETHSFRSPTDEQCLCCHYGNTVGADYYGRFERDYNEEYRTPFWTGEEAAAARPWGVEFLQLTADIHQQKGMQCIDCHSGNEIMKSGAKPNCRSCHDRTRLAHRRPPGITERDAAYTFTDHNGVEHPLPLMKNRAHEIAGVDCQVCHAQWGFNDMQKSYLRSDTDNYDQFPRLAIQGSSEVERLVLTNNNFDTDDLPIEMTDKLTGKKMPGIWYKGFLMRRWDLQLGRRDDGTITTVRPLLDYQLSWIDEEDQLQIDSAEARPAAGVYRPYTPHTTGPAGLFYMDRIRKFERFEAETENGKELWIQARPKSKTSMEIVE